MWFLVDDLTGSAIIALLQQHLNELHLTLPPESVHALDLIGLRAVDVSFWTLWLPTHRPSTAEQPRLHAPAKPEQLDVQTAEIKSMRTTPPFRCWSLLLHRCSWGGVGFFLAR